MPPDDNQEVLLLLLLLTWEIVMPFLDIYAFPKKEFSSPPPPNSAYEHMALAVFLSLAFTNLLAITPGSPLYGFPFLSFRDMQMILLSGYGIASLCVGCYGSGALWLGTGLMLLAFRIVRFRSEVAETREVYVTSLWPYHKVANPQTSWLRRVPLPGKAVALRVVQIVMGLGMWVGPVLGHWGKAAPYVRWYPLNEASEVLWRVVLGVLATYMLVAASDPWLLNRGMTGFLVVCPLLVSGLLLADNLRGADGNGNHQHLYGDLLAWLLIGVLHLCLGPWLEWLVMSRGYGPIKPRFVIAGEATRLMAHKKTPQYQANGEDGKGGVVVHKLGNGVFADKLESHAHEDIVLRV